MHREKRMVMTIVTNTVAGCHYFRYFLPVPSFLLPLSLLRIIAHVPRTVTNYNMTMNLSTAVKW